MGNRLEHLSALQLILWGAWVASPFWDSLSSVVAYHYLDMMVGGNGYVWGLLAIVLGVGQAVLGRTAHIRLRAVLALCTIFFWVTITVSIMLGNYTSTGSVGYLAFVVMNAVILRELFARKP